MNPMEASTKLGTALDLILKTLIASPDFNELQTKNWDAISRLIPGSSPGQVARRFEELLMSGDVYALNQMEKNFSTPGVNSQISLTESDLRSKTSGSRPGSGKQKGDKDEKDNTEHKSKHHERRGGDQGPLMTIHIVMKQRTEPILSASQLPSVSLDDEHEVAADDDHSKKDDLRDQHESACGKQGDEVPALAGLQNEMNDEEIVTSDYLSSDEDRDIDTEDHNKSKSNVSDDTTKRKRNLSVTAHGTKTKKAKMGVDCDEDIDTEDHNKSKSNVSDDTTKRKRNLLFTAHGTEMKKAQMGVDCDEGRKKLQRNPWSEEDTELVRKYFHYHIVKRSPPSKSDICLQGRKNEKVKCLIDKRGWKKEIYDVWSLAQQHDKKVKKLLK